MFSTAGKWKPRSTLAELEHGQQSLSCTTPPFCSWTGVRLLSHFCAPELQSQRTWCLQAGAGGRHENAWELCGPTSAPAAAAAAVWDAETPGPAAVWSWLAPPLAAPALPACQARTVSCRACGTWVHVDTACGKAAGPTASLPRSHRLPLWWWALDGDRWACAEAVCQALQWPVHGWSLWAWLGPDQMSQ